MFDHLLRVFDGRESVIEGWYNPLRLQRALGWRSPSEFENHHYAGHDLTVAATDKRAPVLVGVKEDHLDPASAPAPNAPSDPERIPQEP